MLNSKNKDGKEASATDERAAVTYIADPHAYLTKKLLSLKIINTNKVMKWQKSNERVNERCIWGEDNGSRDAPLEHCPRSAFTTVGYKLH